MSKGVLGKIKTDDSQTIFDAFYELENSGVQVEGANFKPEITLIEDGQLGRWKFPTTLRLGKTFDNNGKPTSYYDEDELEPVAVIELPEVLTKKNGYWASHAIVYRFPDGSYRTVYDESDKYDDQGSEEDAIRTRGIFEGIVNERLLGKNIEKSPLNLNGSVVEDNENQQITEGEIDLDDIYNNFGSFTSEEQEVLRPALEQNGYKNF